MTTSKQTTGGLQQQQGAPTVPLGWLSLFIATLLITLGFALHTAAEVYKLLALKGWAKYLHSDTLWLDCLMNNACSSAFQSGWMKRFPLWSLGLPFFGLVLYARGARPRTFVTKDPGLSWWAQLDDEGLDPYFTTDKDRPENRHLGYVGHLLPVDNEGNIDYRKVNALYVRMDTLAENVLVLGGVGAGKTRGYFRPLIMLGALQGFTVIVFDLKYPQADSGFFDMIGLWKKRGRSVQMFTPFSENTMRLPLLDSVEDYASALSCATTIMPPPEYGLETGKHYRDRDRGVLAAFLLAVAKSDTPNFGELLRMAQYTPKELKKWFELQQELDVESEVVRNLKGLFAQGTTEVASVLLGIKNALRIFYNPLLARATQSQEGENMDLERAFLEPTLIYVGIQQEFMMEGDGVVLLQLVKRFIDRALLRSAERQGGKVKLHVAYTLDEFPSFGLLPYMMRMLGVLRSYNVSSHLGVQNLAQLAQVYGENYTEALTTNVIGHTIFFPRAVDGKERLVFSERMGMITVNENSESDSRRAAFGSSLDEGTRQGVTWRKVPRSLLSPEEFSKFRAGEAVVLSRGNHPIRVFMPAIEDKFLRDRRIHRRIPNGLHVLYRQVNPHGENMATFTRALIESGDFGVKANAGVNVTQAQDRFVGWVQGLLEAGTRVRFSGVDRRLYVRLSGVPESLRGEALLRGHHSRDWTGSPQGDELRITPTGWTLLPSDVRLEINRRATFGSVLVWMDRYATLIEGRSERGALPEADRVAAAAILQGGAVLLRHKVARELFGVVPEQLNKRIGKSLYIKVDLTDPVTFWDVLQEARKDADRRETEDTPLSATPQSAPEKLKGRGKQRAPSTSKNQPALWTKEANADGADQGGAPLEGDPVALEGAATPHVEVAARIQRGRQISDD